MPASFDSDVDIKVEVAFDSEPFACKSIIYRY